MEVGDGLREGVGVGEGVLEEILWLVVVVGVISDFVLGCPK